MNGIAILICEQCGESTDVGIHEHMGATDLLPAECPWCDTEWSPDALNDPETEIYA